MNNATRTKNMYFNARFGVDQNGKWAKIRFTIEPKAIKNLRYGFENDSNFYTFDELRKKVVEIPIREDQVLCFNIINQETKQKEKICIDVLKKYPQNISEDTIIDVPANSIDISKIMEKLEL